eukprot:5219308-Amphidinium_carterae.3
MPAKVTESNWKLISTNCTSRVLILPHLPDTCRPCTHTNTLKQSSSSHRFTDPADGTASQFAQPGIRRRCEGNLLESLEKLSWRHGYAVGFSVFAKEHTANSTAITTTVAVPVQNPKG